MKNSLPLIAFAGSAALNAKQAPPVVFTMNAGKVRDQFGAPRADVLFGGTSGNLNFHIRKTGVSYQLLMQSLSNFVQLMNRYQPADPWSLFIAATLSGWSTPQ